MLRRESEDGMHDGMDLSICIIDKKKGEIHFSGARNGIYVIDTKSAKHYDADLLPVGGFSSKNSKETERNYTQQKIKITNVTTKAVLTTKFFLSSIAVLISFALSTTKI